MITKLFRILATFVGIASPTLVLAAADQANPTWPCVQRKVEQLSPGLMWAHPIPTIKLDHDTAKAVDSLVGQLVLRRLPLEEIQPTVAAFADSHGHSPEMMGYLFEKSFDRLSHLRTRILKGIDDYGQSQIDLADRIDQARTEMDQLSAAQSPDFDKIDALEVQIDWDERVYDDRRKSLTYVCETPVLLEKRLYGIAQMLEAQIGG